jgi:putative flavoprotein involved in K+ transport
MTAANANGVGEPAQDRPLDVIVIGAGQAGLAVAWHLARRGVRFVILEAADQLAYSWRARWDSLRLFSPAQYDALPGMAFPAPADTYPGKEAVADFLRDYAIAFDLPVRLGKRVTALSRIGDEFEVRAGDDVLRARQVVVATGPFQVPFIPQAARGFDAAVTQLHSTEYRNPQFLPPGPVLVVGGGNSGLQIAEELVGTRQVDVAVGEKVPMLPQRLLGRDLFWWLTRMGFMRVNTATRLGRRLRARGEFVIGTNRRQLKQAGVRFRPRLVNAQGKTARFADGSSLDVPVVIWATGYRSDYSWISIPGVVAHDRVLHRRGVTDVPGLYFLGLSWQYTRGSALLGFVADDAAFLAEKIATRAGADRSTQVDPAAPLTRSS